MMQPLAQTWRRISPRERAMVAVAAVALLIALGWGVGIAPALKVLRTAPAQLDTLDAQMQTMQRLAAEAKAIQARPAMSREDSVRALESSVRQRLGAGAQLRIVGDRATVVLVGCAPEQLAQWLGQVRAASRVVPAQAQLKRGTAGWDGTVVLELPPPT